MRRRTRIWPGCASAPCGRQVVRVAATDPGVAGIDGAGQLELRIGFARPAAATRSRRCRSKPTSPASSPAKRRATARPPRSKCWPSPSAPSRSAIAIATAPTASISATRRTARWCARPRPATDRAAQATAGQVLMRNGAIASMFYSASCGGRTEIPSNVWPGADDPPYLPSSRR